MGCLKTLICGMLFLSVPAWCDPGNTTLPTRGNDLNDVAFVTQATPTATFQIKVVASCMPVNVRNVGNPLAPGSKVTATIPLLVGTGGGKLATVVTNFPAMMSIGTATPGIPDPAKFPLQVTGVSGNVTEAIAGNTMIIKVPGQLNPNGGAPYTLDPNRPLTFYQTVPPNYSDPSLPKSYIGQTGPLTANVTSVLATDGSNLTIHAAFPGAVVPGAIGGMGNNSPRYGLCDSFYSPLMIFFGKNRPQIRAVSSFPLRPEGDKFYWPEGSKQWAFLVYDKKGDGKITNADQLFGNIKYKNGFEALRQLDTNHDGKIDKRDKEFAKIKLWFDLNANGKVDPGEIKTLKQAKIDSISLKYENNLVWAGRRGAFMEKGSALSGKKAYDVIDVWFGVQTPRMEFSNQKKQKGTSNARKKKT